MLRIAIFASGSGTNAENLVRQFEGNKLASIPLILTNKPNAGVIERAKRLNVKCIIFSKDFYSDGQSVLELIKNEKIDFIILAGFLLLMPPDIVESYNGKIINIHPALLPLHGGKGFYGANVHKAVIASGAIMSGITIHYVNEKFDEGEILFQAACHISKTETSESLMNKIHELEYAYFPIVVEKLISQIKTQ